MSMNRRKFIYGATVGTAAAAFTARSWSQVAGANSAIRHAVIGFNSRGQNHIDGFKKLKGVRLVALCDADSAVINKTTKKL